MLYTIQTFAVNHIILGQIVIFFGILITNIVPIMFFFYPDIFIFISVFLVKNGLISWYIPWLLLIIGALIGEYISFFIGKIYGKKILEHKYFQKDLIKKWVEKLYKNGVKTLIIGKIIPGVGWFIPVLSGITNLETKKFIFWDFVMIIYAISGVFFTWLIGLHFAEKIFGPIVRTILGGCFIVYVIGHLIYEFTIKNK